MSLAHVADRLARDDRFADVLLVARDDRVLMCVNGFERRVARFFGHLGTRREDSSVA